jgi:hypothetical protein
MSSTRSIASRLGSVIGTGIIGACNGTLTGVVTGSIGSAILKSLGYNQDINEVVCDGAVGGAILGSTINMMAAGYIDYKNMSPEQTKQIQKYLLISGLLTALATGSVGHYTWSHSTSMAILDIFIANATGLGVLLSPACLALICLGCKKVFKSTTTQASMYHNQEDVGVEASPAGSYRAF